MKMVGMRDKGSERKGRKKTDEGKEHCKMKMFGTEPS